MSASIVAGVRVSRGPPPYVGSYELNCPSAILMPTLRPFMKILSLPRVALGAYLGALLLSSARPLVAAAIAPTPVTGRIQWVMNYDEGKKLARANGKPLLVVFRCER